MLDRRNNRLSRKRSKQREKAKLYPTRYSIRRGPSFSEIMEDPAMGMPGFIFIMVRAIIRFFK